MINKFNIAKPEKYISKDGQEKTIWHNIGTVTEFIKQDGGVSKIIEIPAINLKANIFPITPKDQVNKVEQNNTKTTVVDAKGVETTQISEVSPDDIPF